MSTRTLVVALLTVIALYVVIEVVLPVLKKRKTSDINELDFSQTGCYIATNSKESGVATMMVINGIENYEVEKDFVMFYDKEDKIVATFPSNSIRYIIMKREL